jgi:hypothetical protein
MGDAVTLSGGEQHTQQETHMRLFIARIFMFGRASEIRRK